MKDNDKSPTRPMQLPRKGGWKGLLLERFGFKESQTRARSRRSQPSMLPFTVQNPLPTRKCEKQLLLATQNRSLEENPPLLIRAVYYLSLSTNYFFLLSFLFLLSKMRPPWGMSKQKNSFTLFERH